MKSYKLDNAMMILLVLMGIFMLNLGSVQGATQQSSIEAFDFTDRNNVVHNIKDFSSKPILIEWGASWCTACKANIETMKQIFSDYEAHVSFISLSYGGSGDTVADLNNDAYSQGVDWILGLDHTNYASKLNVRNGFFTFLTPDLEIFKTYSYIALVTPTQVTQLRSDLNKLLTASGLTTVPLPNENVNTGNNLGNSGINFPFEIVLVIAIVTLGGLAFMYTQKVQKKENVEKIVSQADKKQEILLADLRDVTASSSSKNIPAKPLTDGNTKSKRRNRRKNR